MNTNTMRCINVNEKNIVKEFKLGSTTIKFSGDCIAKTKEERRMRIRNFKELLVKLQRANDKRNGG